MRKLTFSDGVTEVKCADYKPRCRRIRVRHSEGSAVRATSAFRQLECTQNANSLVKTPGLSSVNPS